MIKLCAKCSLSKPISEFYKDNRSKDKLQSYCKTCKKSLMLGKKYGNGKTKKISKDACLKKYYRNRVSMNFSRRMRKALNSDKSGMSWESLVGYSLKDLKLHLEQLFSDGMSWDNYGLWHIDHIKPVSLFDLSLQDDFDTCWSLDNLQPLWASENRKKSNKYVDIRLSIGQSGFEFP